MHNTWFIGDTHFGHANILQFEPIHRPFATLDEMHEALIERWNNVVRKGDKVYHLGDFCFGRGNIAFADHLNGHKHLIMGNHDKYPSSDYLHYFESLNGALFWNSCLLTHVPVHPNQMQHRCKLNVHGHYHSKHVLDGVDEKDNRYFNVSCENNNLTPFSADIILHHLKNL